MEGLFKNGKIRYNYIIDSYALNKRRERRKERNVWFMIKFENHLGSIEISQDYFANLVGHAASECFGVAGMVESTASQGLRYILKKDDAQDKGVKVHTVGGSLVIDLHIAVTYGVNISEIVKSIVNKVRYTVEQATGLQVSKVNVFVDDMKQE